MRMIPSTPYDTRSRAELVVFDCLRGLTLAGDGSHQGIAFHSLNLTRHPYKRFGEIDFLVTSPRGILVLEVKGGGVKCIDGRWVYTDRAGKEHTKNESPFRQAESALHGLIGRLQDRFLKRALDELVFGYGVIFPDCEWRQAGSEWDPHTLADAKAFRRFDRWLDSLYNYWLDKAVLQRKGDGASTSALQEIQSFLRPDFETIPALGSQIRQIEENLVRLTDDQYALLDIVEANPRTLCTSGAGTGKTLLAAELARRWTASGAHVLLVCASPWLKAWIHGQLAVKGLTISTCDAVPAAARRAGISHFDKLIVDEAQDLMQTASLDILDAHLKGSLSQGNWCMFGDLQNQAGLVGQIEQEALEWISQIVPARLPLRVNCRNTLQVIKTIKDKLGADMGIRGTGSGPTVRLASFDNKTDATVALDREIKELGNLGVAHSQITILSPVNYRASLAAELPTKTRAAIRELDEYGIRNFPPDAISFSTIANFKGLENDAVIVIDLPAESAPSYGALSYVGMSRARAILIVLGESRRLA
ncbi:MAG: NERD domain-containing protein [Candidatus Accumulibacter propinquus]|jgi:hypothetical protein